MWNGFAPPSDPPVLPMRHKFLFLFALLLLASAAGLWLSGFMTLTLLGLDTGQAGFGLYLDYLRTIDNPQVAPFAPKIKVAGLIGFGFPGLLWLCAAVLLLKPKAKALHGDAKFASGGELARPRSSTGRWVSSAGLTCSREEACRRVRAARVRRRGCSRPSAMIGPRRPRASGVIARVRSFVLKSRSAPSASQAPRTRPSRPLQWESVVWRRTTRHPTILGRRARHRRSLSPTPEHRHPRLRSLRRRVDPVRRDDSFRLPSCLDTRRESLP